MIQPPLLTLPALGFLALCGAIIVFLLCIPT